MLQQARQLWMDGGFEKVKLTAVVIGELRTKRTRVQPRPRVRAIRIGMRINVQMYIVFTLRARIITYTHREHTVYTYRI